MTGSEPVSQVPRAFGLVHCVALAWAVLAAFVGLGLVSPDAPRLSTAPSFEEAATGRSALALLELSGESTYGSAVAPAPEIELKALDSEVDDTFPDALVQASGGDPLRLELSSVPGVSEPSRYVEASIDTSRLWISKGLARGPPALL